MRKKALRIFSGFLTVIVISFAIVPAFATNDFGGGSYGGGGSRSGFFEWSNGFGGGTFGGGGGRDDSKAAYDTYVETLPADNINSDGLSNMNIGGWTYECLNDSGTDCVSNGALGIVESHIEKPFFRFLIRETQYGRMCYPRCYSASFSVPVSGTYSFCFPPVCSDNSHFISIHLFCSVDGGETWTDLLSDSFWKISKSIGSDDSYHSEFQERTYKLSSAALYRLQVILGIPFVGESVGRELAEWFSSPIYVKGVQLFSVGSDIYAPTTRPTSITGGNYGVVGDNNQITKVEDNSTIVNETNNTYYNPATGDKTTITDWSYDYSDRSYTLTLEGDKTSTVTYGDENISIVETTVNESGDTITNNYTIYYLVDGSGTETPPATCDHAWTETSTTPATCTVPGSKLLTCSKCSETKTESIPALGHDWQVKQSVATQYDETGQLTQEGYTIFECSRCHEQYKSSDGTVPPGGGSGTDPGGEGKETIWQKIGKLFGTIGDGIIGLIEAAVGKVLDGLISLVEMITEKLKTVVETVLSIFDELPKLFGGFLSFLSAVFPFLPPELMAILTFGIAAVVFIAIIKAVRR